MKMLNIKFKSQKNIKDTAHKKYLLAIILGLIIILVLPALASYSAGTSFTHTDTTQADFIADGNATFTNVNATPDGDIVMDPITNIFEDFEDTSYNLDFTSSGDASWYRDTSKFYAGSASFASGAITDNQSTTMQTTVNLPFSGTVSFYCLVSSELFKDAFNFYIDGVSSYGTTGINTTFVKVSRSLPAGTHTLKWTYSKNSSGSQGSDKVWIDNLTIQYPVSGIYESQVFDISQVAGAESSSISWHAYVPAFTSLALKTNLSLDGGNTWKGWTATETDTSGTLRYLKDYNLSNARLKYQATLTSSNGVSTPSLHDVSINITPDTTKPTVTVAALPQNVPTSVPVLQATVTDTGKVTKDNILFVVDGIPYTATSYYFWSGSASYTPTLADGTHTLTVQATDNAGNTAASDPITFYVDANAPAVTDITPHFTNTGSLTLSNHVSDAASGLAEMRYSVEAYSDDFNDNAIGTKWSAYGTGSYSNENLGSLNINIPSPTAATSSGYQSVQTISGDFDIQVDYSNYNYNGFYAGNSSLSFYIDDNNWLKIMRNRAAYKGYNDFQGVSNIGGVNNTGYASTNTAWAVSGKLRITRTGSTVSTYYDTGSGWKLVSQKTGFSTAPGNIRLYGYAETGVTMSVNFDNLIVWNPWESYSENKNYTLSGGDGQKPLYALFKDKAGNCAPFAGSITLDKAAPSINIIKPTDGETVSANSVVQASIADTGSGIDSSSIVFKVDGNIKAPNLIIYNPDTGNFSYPVTLSAGSRNLSLEVQDKAGNPATTAWTVNVNNNNSAPVIAVLAPIDGQTVVTGSPTVQATLSNSDGSIDSNSIKFIIDDTEQPLTPIDNYYSSGTFTYTPALTDGTHILYLEAQSSTGLKTTSTWTVTVDSAGPVIGGLAPEYSKNLKPVFTANVSDATSGIVQNNIKFFIDSNPNEPAAIGVPASSYSGGTAFYTPESNLTEGSHTLIVTATDNAGNTTSSTLTFSVDQAGPIVTGLAPQSTASVRPNFTVNIADVISGVTQSNIQFYLDGNPGAVPDSFFNGVATYTPAADLTLGTHAVTIKATDSAGNVSEVFYGISILDNVGPTISNLGAQHTNSLKPTLSASVSDVSGCDLILFVIDGTSYGNMSGNTSFSDGVATFTPYTNLTEGPHTLNIKAMDYAFNWTTSDSITFTIDATGPAVSGFEPQYTASTQPTLSANVSDDISGVNNIRFLIDDVIDVTPSFSDGIATYTPATPLSDGNHTLVVKATDNFGNTTTSSFSFLIDRTGPTVAELTPADGTTTGLRPAISASISDITGINASSVVLKVDGSTVAANFNAGTGVISYTPQANLKNGPHTITLTASDKLGNPITTSWSFIANGTAFDYTATTQDDFTTDGTTNTSTTATTAGDVVLTTYPGSLEEDFEDTLYNFSFSGSWDRYYDGLGTPFFHYDGHYSFASPYIPNFGKASTETTVNLATSGKIRFWYCVNSASGDYLRFYIDGIEQFKACGAGEYNTTTGSADYPLTAGPHTLRWAYTKDSSITRGHDQAWIDDLYVYGLNKYESNGNFESQVFDLSQAGFAQNSSISWNADVPTGTSLDVQTKLSLDWGNTWQEWQNATNGQPISGITPTTNLNMVRLKYRATLTTLDPNVTPQLQQINLHIDSDNTPPVIDQMGPLYTNTATPVLQARICDNTIDAANTKFLLDGNPEGAPITSSSKSGNYYYVRCNTTLAPGTHTMVVKAVDVSGNTAASEPFTFYVDTTGPSATVQIPPNMINPTLSADISDDLSGVTKDNIKFLIDGSSTGVTPTDFSNGVATYTPTTLDTGTHTLIVEATDNAGNTTTTSSLTFYIDNTGPTIENIRPQYINILTATLEADVSDDSGIKDIKFIIDGDTEHPVTPNFSGGVASYTSNLTEGPHTLAVIATDNAGNTTTSSTFTFTVDTTGPAITGLAPQYTNSLTPTLTANVDDPTSGVTPNNIKFIIDGDINAAGVPASAFSGGVASYTPAANLTEGSHTLLVKATDNAGNTTISSTHTFSVDATKPVVTAFEPEYTNNNYPTLSVDVSDALSGVTRDNIKFVLDDVIEVTPSFSDSKATYTPDIPLSEGDHNLVVKATDNFGNTTTSSFTFHIDNTGPNINNPGPEYVNILTPILSANVSDAVSGVTQNNIKFIIDGDTNATGEPASAFFDGVATYSPILTAGTHTLIVKATDNVGNTTTSLPFTFHTDNEAPTVTVEVPQYFTSQTPTLSAIVSDIASGVSQSNIQFILNDTSYTASTFLDNVASITPTLADGTYTLTVQAADNVGNTIISSTYAFSVDTTGPGVSGLEPQYTNNNQPTLSANVSDNISGVTIDNIRFLLDDVIEVTPSFIDGKATYTPDIPLTENAHTLVVKATDNVGNTTSSTLTFYVDQHKPLVTAFAPQSTNNVRPTFSVTIADNLSGVTQSYIRFYLDDNPGAAPDNFSGNVATYTPATDLTKGNHLLMVEVTDNAGNSSKTYFSTSVLDDTGPTISDLGPQYANSLKPTMSAKVSDDSGVDLILFVIDGISYGNMSGDTSFSNGVATFTPSWNLTEGPHTLYIKAMDYASNWTTSSTITFTVDATAPAVSVLEPQYTNVDKPTLSANVSDAGSGVTIDNIRFLLDDVIDVTPDDFSNGVATYTPAAPLSEGLHTLVVTATDKAGNTTSSSLSFFFDHIAPTITALTPADGKTTGPKPAISATLNDISGINVSSVVLKVDGSTVAANFNAATGVVSYTPQDNLINGPHTITLTASDNEDNQTTTNWSFTANSTTFDYTSTTQADFTSPETISSNINLTAAGDLELKTQYSTYEDFEGDNFINFVNSGEAGWSCVDYWDNDGVRNFGFRSGPTSFNSYSATETTVNLETDGTVGFRYNVYSRENSDFFRFYIDGVQYLEDSGYSVEYMRPVSYYLSAGVHKLKWVFSVDNSPAYLNGCGALIDDLTVTNTTTYNNTTYTPSGSYESQVFDLSDVGIAQNSTISWDANVPANTTLIVNTNLSLDGGTTWQGWKYAANGQPISGITPTTNLSNARLKFRAFLSSTTTTNSPVLHALNINIYGDVTPPTISGLEATNTNTNNPVLSTTIADNCSGIDPNSVLFYIDDATTGIPAATFAGGVATYTPTLADGPHSFVVTAVDNVGNLATSSKLNFTVDTTAPAINGLSINTSSSLTPTLNMAALAAPRVAPQSTSRYTNKLRPTLSAYVSDTISGVSKNNIRFLIDGNVTAISALTSNGKATCTPATNLKEGSHTLVVKATDNAGNTTTSSSFTFYVDKSGPSVTKLAPRNTNKLKPTLSAYVSDAISGVTKNNIKFFIDGNTTGVPALTFSKGKATYTPAKNLTVGSHTLVVKATDNAGNTTSSKITFTVR